MADFVAVIRRTVDGLSENTPEMRDKVYEKARAAVRRQLENMNPRPSDDMINRQLAKLENAIGEVDSEYAEALPAIDEVEPEADIVEAEAPVAVEPEPVDVVETPAEPVMPEAESEPVTAVAEEPVAEVVAEPDYADASAEVHEQPETYDEPVPVEAPVEHVETAPEPVEDTQAVEQQAEPSWQPPVEDELPVAAQTHDEEIVAPAEPIAEEVYDHRPAAPAIEPEPVQEVTWDAPVIEPAAQAPARSEWELPDWEDTQSTPAPSAPDAGPDTVAYEPELLGMHPVEDRPHEVEPTAPKADASRSWSFDDDDPFASITERPATKASDAEISDWSWPVEKTSSTPAATTADTASEQERAGTAWDHIDDLLGLENGATTAAGAAAGVAAAKDADRGFEMPAAAPSRPTSYRATPKPSRFSVKRLAIAAGLLLVLGGGGFAYWQNREAGNAWISGVVASITSAVSSNGEPAAQQTTPPEQTNETATQQPAAHDDTAVPDNASTKFTQRLLADGSETDAGPAVLNGESTAQEGKSIAQQTEAGKPQENVAGTPGTDAGTAAGQQPGAQPAQPDVAIANGEKMFLYEERLGQSSPTAIPGTVAWSVKEESPGGDAKPEPAIQAQITVPDRGLTALMTIKRNADPSLPASHVIEFVFSLPQNFEGGAIDGVQRVSMKRTEQDRGDALIAVPAKITDDFHMIALNDFAEAVGSNTELLRSRGWIDIPLTYRNGRRALLTLEKGQSGNEAFSQAMRAWGSAGNTAATGQ